MKNLITSTENSATYEFTSGTSLRTVVYEKPEGEVETPDFDAMAEAEHQAWLAWLGVTE
jgi:hypothetical protein